jgi:hypothetical protein
MKLAAIFSSSCSDFTLLACNSRMLAGPCYRTPADFFPMVVAVLSGKWRQLSLQIFMTARLDGGALLV